MKKNRNTPLHLLKTTLLSLGLWAGIILFSLGTSYGQLQLPISTGEMTRPKPGMNADQLMQIYFHVKFSKDSNDYTAQGGTELISKGGLKRERGWQRSRIILNRVKDDLDYKDIVSFTSPENVKGLSVLSWTYLSLGRDQEVWLWLPSLRKTRRIQQNDGDDSFMGTDFSYEEVVSRKWGDETYTMVGEEKFSGYKSIHNGETYYKDSPCYVIEARPKKKDWYYSKRTVYLEKNTAFRILDSYYDQMGRNSKKIFVYWKPIEGSKLDMEWLLEVAELRGEHSTIIDLTNVEFNTGLTEKYFTLRTLKRMKW